MRRADTWWSRAIGLLATASLDDSCGLWITPCASVHTLGMRYPIDVVFLRRDGTVIKMVSNLRPWRAAACAGAAVAVELRAGSIKQFGLRLGMAIALALS
ncbi:DUF192 domain-containing protein [Ideonella sp.]|uniref:DUF192 domain-containing protein n=1 Tax=Ideonella sp. TaxID=1929293 RepID=UPI002B49D6B3|nr:DUF192 domain-containing protein [Ideonella sp.]HJV70300.1 DUF192 domain-containing protein [Ideonella sp.]